MHPMRGGTILIVDDTKIVCIALRLILAEDGYEVDTACDGKEAIQRARQKQYDVVFLDLLLPDLDGIEVCRAIKKISPRTECVLMTGYAGDDLAAKEQAFIQAGGRVLAVYKPLEVNQVLCLTRELLRAHGEQSR